MSAYEQSLRARDWIQTQRKARYCTCCQMSCALQSEVDIAHNDEDDTYYRWQHESSNKRHCYRCKEKKGRDDPNWFEHLFELSPEAARLFVSYIEGLLSKRQQEAAHIKNPVPTNDMIAPTANSAASINISHGHITARTEK